MNTGRELTEEDDPLPPALSEPHASAAASESGDSSGTARNAHSYTLGDFFTIKRGIETGDNDFFLLTPAQIMARDLPLQFLRPILPGPQSLPDDEITTDPEGHPILGGKMFLLDCPLPEREVREAYPSLWAYLERGIHAGVPERYICRHRTPWYAQERRPPALYLCAYMGREYGEGAPFRFILNHSKAVAPNIYLMMYPRPALARRLRDNYPLQVRLWTALNGIGTDEISRRERVYDDAAGRLEPLEMASVPADRVVALIPDLVPDSVAQLGLFD